MFRILEDPDVSLMLALSAQQEVEADVWEQLNNTDMAAFFQLCKAHELHGVVGSRVRSAGKELPPDWLSEYEEEQARLSFFKEKTKSICSILAADGIPMIALKNGGIMQDIIEDPAACPMEDIDSLVRKEDFLRAHHILVDNGFTFKFRSEFEFEKLEEAFADGAAEYYFLEPSGQKMWFELSWRSVSGRWIRPDKEPDTDLMFERYYIVPETNVGILSPEDNLLQVCVHTAKHSYVRAPGLRLHLDVDRIVTHKKIDWPVFLERVRQAHVCTSTYYSLWIPKILFGTPVPEDVLAELRPSPRKDRRICGYLAKAGLLNPKEQKFNKFAFLAFQTALYDGVGDILRVIYPSWSWYKARYRIRLPLLLPIYILLRFADLIGLRKKKRDM